MRDEAKKNFDAWFGASKVVDDEGNPRVVYHGSIVRPDNARVQNMGNIDAFDRLYTTKFRRPSIDTVGSWFSTNPGEQGAGLYSGTGNGAVVYPVYLSIQNPQETTFHLMLRRSRLLANGKDDGRIVGEAEVNAYRQWLDDIGKDGIKIVHDSGSESTEFAHQDAWIALHPHQIKSATGNNGLYARDNHDIADRRIAAANEALDYLASVTKKAVPHA